MHGYIFTGFPNFFTKKQFTGLVLAFLSEETTRLGIYSEREEFHPQKAPMRKEEKRENSTVASPESLCALRRQCSKKDGQTTCDFRSFSTVFQSYQDNGWMRMKGCMQW